MEVGAEGADYGGGICEEVFCVDDDWLCGIAWGGRGMEVVEQDAEFPVSELRGVDVMDVCDSV